MRHTLVALMEDRPGVLGRVARLFRCCNYNIESLSVGASETVGFSRMTIVLEGDDRVVDRIVRQLNKLINVTDVADVTTEPTVTRELALIKVGASNGTRAQVMELAQVFRGHVIDVGSDSLTVEITGSEEKVNSLVGLLRPLGIKEMARTGRVSMVRSSTMDATGMPIPAPAAQAAIASPEYY
jgi:acetolactate synthase I/III small subunit